MTEIWHRKVGVVVGLVFLVALGLRLVGIGWGLPNEQHDWSYHPDEPIIWGAAQQGVTPGFYNYGTLYLIVVKTATDVVFATSYDSADPRAAARWIGNSHLVGRIVSAAAGAATAAIVIVILWPFLGRLGSVAGGLLVAFAPAHVVHSRFQTVDVLAFFLLTLSAMFALRFLVAERKSGLSDALLAGLFAGLSAGTKYTGILVLLTLYACLMLAKPPGARRLGGIGTLAAVGAFLLATPGAWLDTQKFLEDFVYEVRHTSSGHGLVFAGTAPGYAYHVANLFAGIGVLGAMLGVSGLMGAAWKRHAWALALLAFAVPYYLLIGGAEVKFLRYTFPLYLGLAAGFGWLVAAAHRRGGVWRAVVAVGIVALGGESYLAGLRGSVTYSAWMVTPDPRDEAASYLKSQSGPEATVGLFSDPWFYTAALYPDVGMPRPMYQRQGPATMAAATGPRVALAAPGRMAEFVTTSSLETGDLERLSRLNPASEHQAEIEKWKAFRSWLEAEYTLDRRFGGGAPSIHDLEYVRPEVLVWKRK